MYKSPETYFEPLNLTLLQTRKKSIDNQIKQLNAVHPAVISFDLRCNFDEFMLGVDWLLSKDPHTFPSAKTPQDIDPDFHMIARRLCQISRNIEDSQRKPIPDTLATTIEDVIRSVANCIPSFDEEHRDYKRLMHSRVLQKTS